MGYKKMYKNTLNVDVSIIIPLKNDGEFIGQCIKSIINNKTKYQIEIIVIDGNSNDNSIGIVSQYIKKYNNIRIIRNPKEITPIAINLGIKASKGNYVIIAGAHSEYRSNYIDSLIEICKNYNADISGSIGEIKPQKDSYVGKAIAATLSDKFGVGNSLFRIGVKDIIETDTVAYGCYKRDVFEKFGLFDERLIRNQDIEFNKRIKNKGGVIKITPKTKFCYYARSTYKDLAKNNFENGLWSVLTPFIVKDFKSQSIRHFVPLVFVLSMLLPLLFSIIKKELAIISIFILILYFNFAFLRSLYLSRKRKIPLFQILIAFFILHFSYGIGSLIGIIKILINGSKIRGKNAQ